MNPWNGARRSLAIHGIERYGIGKAKHDLTICSGDEPAHSFGRNRARSSSIDGLHVDARFVARFRAAKYNILAIREKTSVTPVNGVMRDLLRFPWPKGNQV